MSLIEEGCTLQQAREVLPLSIKSELISCGFEDAWTNFIRISSKYEDIGLDSMAIEIANKLVEDYMVNQKNQQIINKKLDIAIQNENKAYTI